MSFNAEGMKCLSSRRSNDFRSRRRPARPLRNRFPGVPVKKNLDIQITSGRTHDRHGMHPFRIELRRRAGEKR
jgi:hypothetical protein